MVIWRPFSLPGIDKSVDEVLKEVYQYFGLYKVIFYKEAVKAKRKEHPVRAFCSAPFRIRKRAIIERFLVDERARLTSSPEASMTLEDYQRLENRLRVFARESYAESQVVGP